MKKLLAFVTIIEFLFIGIVSASDNGEREYYKNKYYLTKDKNVVAYDDVSDRLLGWKLQSYEKVCDINDVYREPTIKEKLSIACIDRFGDNNVDYLFNLLESESGFDINAVNPTSRACGIFQAYPCEKIASIRGDIDKEISWGLDYIENRYKTPKNAYLFKLEHNWY